MKEFVIEEGQPYVELIRLLKALRIAESGGQAKMMVNDGCVHVNGELEYRKRKKLRPGDKVEIFDETIVIR
jgi:ribosome-associated protein